MKTEMFVHESQLASWKAETAKMKTQWQEADAEVNRRGKTIQELNAQINAFGAPTARINQLEAEIRAKDGQIRDLSATGAELNKQAAQNAVVLDAVKALKDALSRV